MESGIKMYVYRQERDGLKSDANSACFKGLIHVATCWKIHKVHLERLDLKNVNGVIQDTIKGFIRSKKN
jgi:hypothetical protein